MEVDIYGGRVLSPPLGFPVLAVPVVIVCVNAVHNKGSAKSEARISAESSSLAGIRVGYPAESGRLFACPGPLHVNGFGFDLESSTVWVLRRLPVAIANMILLER